MSEETIFWAAAAAAVLIVGIGWYAMRHLSSLSKWVGRIALLAAAVAALGALILREPPSRPKTSSGAEALPPPPARSQPPPKDAATAPPRPMASAPPAAPAPAQSAPVPSAAPPVATTMPAPGARRSADTTPAGTDLWDVVRVFYGTDRQRGTSNKRLTYTADRASRLDLGRADITVPKAHQVPNIERPFAIRVPFTSITLYEASEDPAKHFTVREIKGLTQASFLDEVRARLTRSVTFKDRAVVFIHGYNTDFDFALYRTAQMAYDLKFDGAPFLYSWPSASGIAGYVSDRDSAEQSEPFLRTFLELIIRDTGAKNISLIAHSMGNVPLLRVLQDISPKLPDGVKIDQVILAAPDVDSNVFAQQALNIVKLGRGVTLYASSQDRAMKASRLLAGGTRAGDVPADGPVIVPGLDSIDVSATTMDSLTLGHSLYAERTALVADIAALLQTGLRPPEKRMPTLLRIDTPRGVYWRVP